MRERDTIRIRHRDRLTLRELRAPKASRERALFAVTEWWRQDPSARFDADNGDKDSALRTTTIRVGERTARRIETWKPDEMSTAAAVGQMVRHYDEHGPGHAPRTSSDSMALPFNMDRSGLTDDTNDDGDRRPVV